MVRKDQRSVDDSSARLPGRCRLTQIVKLDAHIEREGLADELEEDEIRAMNTALEVCPDCKVALSPTDGPRHPYLGGSASCWAAYGELLAREYGHPTYMSVHRLTVDAYCAQHPGLPERRTIQSINVHLAGLCLVQEREMPGDMARRYIARLTEKHEERFCWLQPPIALGKILVTDVLAASSSSAHVGQVRRWAEAVWTAWEPHHEHIRGLVETALLDG